MPRRSRQLAFGADRYTDREPLKRALEYLWIPGCRDFCIHIRSSVREIETPIVVNKDENKMERLQRMIRPFILRRLKGDTKRSSFKT